MNKMNDYLMIRSYFILGFNSELFLHTDKNKFLAVRLLNAENAFK